MDRFGKPEVTLLKEVGRGRGGIVYRARHPRGNCLVKLASERPGRLARDRQFEQDMLALARMGRLGFPRLLELGRAGDTPYALLEEREGELLRDRLQRPLPHRACVAILQGLCESLDALHSAGFVCGGLQLDDVSVVECGGRPRVHLRDRGTLVRSSSRGGAADLRSLAELLYACARALELPRGSMAVAVERLAAALGAGAFSEVRPLARALAALARPAAVASPSSYPPPAELPTPPWGTVAARLELSRLRKVWELAPEQGGRVVEVRGPAGSGKTHLLSAFARELADTGVLVLSVKCHDRDWAPYSALKRLLDAHVAGLSQLPPARRAQVERSLREAAGAMGPLVRLLSPKLADLFQGSAAAIAEGDARQIFVGGMAEFLARYLESAPRALLVIDDMHWLDASSRDVLSLAISRACARGLVVLCGARNDPDSEEAVQRFRRRLSPELLEQVGLAPLDERAAGGLLGAFLGLPSAPEGELVRQLLQISDGSPLSLIELLRLCVERGHLRPNWGRWQLDAAAVQRMQLPASSQAVIERRLEDLESTTLGVLRAVAIAGENVSLEVLACASECELHGVEDTIESAIGARLLERSEHGSVRFVHNCAPDVLLSRLSVEARCVLHERIADALLSQGGEGPEYECEIARHLAAGLYRDPVRVYAMTRRAALHAGAACDDTLALSFLKTAEDAAGRAGIELERDLYVELAEASLRTGASGESMRYFERALARSAAGSQRAHVLGRIAWLHHFDSNVELAWNALEAALAELRQRPPGRTPLTLSRTVARWALRLPHWAPGSSAPQAAADLEVLCALYVEDLRLSVEHGEPLRTMSSVLELSLVAARLPPCRTVVYAEMLMAFLLSTLRADKSWRRRLDRTQQMARRLADPIAETLCHQVSHVIYGWVGDLEKSESHARRCAEAAHLMELGEFCHVCFSMYGIEIVRGRPLAALAWIEHAIEHVRQEGRAPASFSLIEDAARNTLLALGKRSEVPRLEQRLQYVARAPIKPGGYFHQLSYQSRVQRLTEVGELGSGFEAMVEEFEALGLNPKRVHLLVVVFYLHVAHARVHQCLRARPDERAALLPKLERATRDVEAAARVPALLAHARFARAACLWWSGKPQQADAMLDKARRLAAEQACAGVSYGVHRLRAHMLRAQGREDAAIDEARIAAMFAREYGYVHRLRWLREEFALDDEPAGHAEAEAPRVRRHLDALLHISQASSRELSPERQARMVLDELLETLGAERAFLFLQRAEGEGLTLCAARRVGEGDLEPTAGYDRGLVDRVYAAGQVELREAESAADAGGHRYRVCLVAPLVMREQPVGVIYLDRPEGAGPFRSGDVELLVALASQVPVALELAGALRERERLEQNLRQAQKMEAIGRFAGGIAHDFNNVLATIKMAADSLQASVGQRPESRQEVDDIEDAARRGAELTRQLLTFSRGETIVPRRFLLGQVVAGLSQMLERLMGAAISLEIAVEEDAPILADPGQIERVVMNLCANARDAMPSGGHVMVLVSRFGASSDDLPLPELAADRQYLRLRIRDTGTGMSDEVRARVFEPFFTTKGKKRGTGLGLANVYAIVEQCHGQIDISSEPGKGTTFDIYFPLAGEQAVPQYVPGDSSLEVDELHDEVVLVVDDDERLRGEMKKALERAGYQVLCAADGEQALKALEAYGGLVDVAVTDVHMPRMDGVQLARRLLRLDPEIRLLFVSGDGNGPLQRAGLLGEGAGFLQKPFVAQTLIDHVRAVLSSPQLAETAAAED